MMFASRLLVWMLIACPLFGYAHNTPVALEVYRHQQKIYVWCTIAQPLQPDMLRMVVERSTDGKTFDYLQSFAAQAGFGSFQLTDEAAVTTGVWYRLRLVKANGQTEFTPASWLPPANKVVINPANDAQWLRIWSSGQQPAKQVTIYSLTHQRVQTVTAPATGGAPAQIAVQHLQPGTYVIEVTTRNGVTSYHRFTKI